MNILVSVVFVCMCTDIVAEAMRFQAKSIHTLDVVQFLFLFYSHDCEMI